MHKTQGTMDQRVEGLCQSDSITQVQVFWKVGINFFSGPGPLRGGSRGWRLFNGFFVNHGFVQEFQYHLTPQKLLWNWGRLKNLHF